MSWHNDFNVYLLSTIVKYLLFRISAEDREIQPPKKKKNSPLNGSIGNGLDITSILHQENGVLRGRSLPTLLDVPLHLNVDAVWDSESDIDATDCKDEEKTLVKVVME